jgi:endoglucanase
MLELLMELTKIPGASGFEDEVGARVRQEMEDCLDSVKVDPLGNVIGILEGSRSGPKIMMCAHMDEVGMLVKHIGDDGALRVELNGVLDHRALLSAEVDVWTSSGSLPGVVGVKSRHLMSQEELSAPINTPDIWVDVGASQREEAISLGIEVGDPILFQPNFRCMAGSTVLSKALDNRTGLTVMLTAMREIADNKPDYTIYFVGTVMEEVGARGAGVAANGINPDAAITLDTVPGTDPSTEPSQVAVSVGEGPTIRVADRAALYNRRLTSAIVEYAKSAGIPHQPEVSSVLTDAATVHLSGRGVPVAGVYIPRRNAHSPAEVASLSDMENAAKLLASFLINMNLVRIKELLTP